MGASINARRTAQLHLATAPITPSTAGAVTQYLSTFNSINAYNDRRLRFGAPVRIKKVLVDLWYVGASSMATEWPTAGQGIHVKPYVNGAVPGGYSGALFDNTDAAGTYVQEDALGGAPIVLAATDNFGLQIVIDQSSAAAPSAKGLRLVVEYEFI